MKKPSVRIQLKGKKLGDPLEEFNDIMNTDQLKDDELFQECRRWALQVYNEEVIMPLARQSRAMNEGSKKPRKRKKKPEDELNKTMRNIGEKFLKKENRLPMAWELLIKIRDGNHECITEIKGSPVDWKEKKDKENIYWKREDNTEAKPICFKKFQERWTPIRKELKAKYKI